MTNEQIEVLRHLATTFGHIGDEDESVAAIKAAISLAERVRDAEKLVSAWRAVAEKQRKRESEGEQAGNEWNEAWYGAMAERSEYCADELESVLKARRTGEG